MLALQGHYKLSSPPSAPFSLHSMHIMQVRLSLFFFCLWQISVSADSTCYWPDGNTVPVHFNYTPCIQTATGVDSACCASGDPCSPNGYCFGSAGYVYRGGCTDINWDADGCCPSCISGTRYTSSLTVLNTDPDKWQLLSIPSATSYRVPLITALTRRYSAAARKPEARQPLRAVVTQQLSTLTKSQ